MAKKRYGEFEKDERVNRWYLNLRAKSSISADIHRRAMLRYCTINNITPAELLEMAKDGSLKDNFQDYTLQMIAEGRKGVYLAKVKDILHSWIQFNDIEYKIRINIPNEHINETTMDERVPTKEELSKILRMGTVRSRVSISLMGFAGFRGEVLGNYEGTDGLTLGDIEDLDIETLTFKNVPAKINVRNGLSKTRLRYFSFLGQEGVSYLKDYIEDRKASGEVLTKETPLFVPDPGNSQTSHGFMRTALISREIRKAIRDSGLSNRPYSLRGYFATALDLAESKRLISHPWRQFLMGHKGDIEATYSTNKRLLPETIEEMRKAYLKCSKFFETVEKGISQDDSIKLLRQSVIDSVQIFSNIEISNEEKEKLYTLSTEEFNAELKKLSRQSKAEEFNGNRNKIIPENELETYLNRGFELVQIYPDGSKAIVRFSD